MKIPEALAYRYKIQAIVTIALIPILFLIGLADPTTAYGMAYGALVGLIAWPFIFYFAFDRAGTDE